MNNNDIKNCTICNKPIECKDDRFPCSNRDWHKKCMLRLIEEGGREEKNSEDEYDNEII